MTLITPNDGIGQQMMANQKKDEYYQDTKSVSFSMLKTFSKCETLYRDTYVTKVYIEPEHDYFLYGKIVDALVTEPREYVDKNFVIVDKRIKPEDALRYENKLAEIREKIEANLEKVAAGNKTAIKGNATREKEAQEIEAKLAFLRSMDGKEQVTKSLWDEAEQTALAIKTHPYFPNMKFDQFTSQQIFTVMINGVSRKGRLDHLKLCPALDKMYRLFVAKQITYEMMCERIVQLDPRELWAIITDVKTCYDFSKLEPYNNHWRGQLSYYQDLVSEFLLIPRDNIKCQIIAGEKVTNRFKMSELFMYTQDALDEVKPDIEALVSSWKEATMNNRYVSAKEKKHFEQDCYTCSECRQSPFSMRIGEPVMITKPRFAKNATNNSQEVTADVDSLNNAIEQALMSV